MARIRSIKPEFFKHLELQELESEHRGLYTMFVYSGLWTQCDKNGVFYCNAKVLKNEILPYLEFDMQKSLDILEKNRYFIKYNISGRDYGFIPTFNKFQFCSANERKQPAKYPEPPKEIIDFQAHIETIPSTSQDVPENVQEQTNGVPEHHTEPTGLQDNRITGIQEEGIQEFTEPQPDSPDKILTAVAVPQKDISKSNKTDLTQEQLVLYQSIKGCFENDEIGKMLLYQDKQSTARELKHIKTIAIRCNNMVPDVPIDFMRNLLEHFKILCNGKYKGKWTFNPQCLITPWIWALVMDSLPKAESQELSNAIKSMKGMFNER